MPRPARLTGLLVACAIAWAAFACSGNGGDDAAPRVPPSPTAQPTSAVEGAAIGRAFMRVANAAPGSEALDVCISLNGRVFGGPFLDTNGLAAGVAFGQVSRYVEIPARRLTVRLVRPATGCAIANAIGPDVLLGADLVEEGYHTLAIEGGEVPQPQLLIDETQSPPEGLVAKVRLLVTDPSVPAFDAGPVIEATGEAWRTFLGMEFAKPPAGARVGEVTPFGYVTGIATYPGVFTTWEPGRDTVRARYPGLRLSPGVMSIFFTSAGAVVCNDTTDAVAPNAGLTSCTVVNPAE
jgi:hypothetical protein